MVMDDAIERTTERMPPVERFQPATIHFDLAAEVIRLNSEIDGGQSGHRQVALYKRETATIALFQFEAGGYMREHQAPGTVFVQVLKGKLSLSAEGHKYTLSDGGLIVFAPGTLHDVFAEEPSVMLLTVCLQREG
jgi:quercetin dioxygenase-like cupin family protein